MGSFGWTAVYGRRWRIGRNRYVGVFRTDTFDVRIHDRPVRSVFGGTAVFAADGAGRDYPIRPNGRRLPWKITLLHAILEIRPVTRIEEKYSLRKRPLGFVDTRATNGYGPDQI